MRTRDLSALVKGLAPVFRDALGGILSRLAILELKEKGLDGVKGEKGDLGPRGAEGRDGRDGKDAQGTDGTDGKDGAPGLGFDDLTVHHDGERTVTFRFLRGDQIKDFAVVFPCPIYRGVYEIGKAYEKGDQVTWGGSSWIAKATTTAKPGDGPTDWILAVKAGRDGKR